MTNNTKTIWEIAIDTGGTFTDCIAIDPQGKRHKTKVLSNSSLRGTIKSCPAADELIIEHDWDAPDDFIKGFSFQVLDRVIEENEVVSYDAVNSTIHLKNTWSAKDLDGCAFAVVTKEEPPILAARLITKTLPDQNLPPINLRLATTRETNALLEIAGAPTAF